MSDELDHRLRQLVAEVGDAAPDAATIRLDGGPDRLSRRRPHRRSLLLVAALIVTMVGGWVLLRPSGSTDVVPSGPLPVPTSTTTTTTTTSTTTTTVQPPTSTVDASIQAELDAISDALGVAETAADYRAVAERAEVFRSSGHLLTDVQAQRARTIGVRANAMAVALEDIGATTSGKFGPELDAVPEDRPLVVVTLAHGAGFVNQTGPIGWVGREGLAVPLDPLERVTVNDPGLVAEPDGVRCIASNELLVCDHDEIAESPMSQIRRILSDGSTEIVGGPGWGPWPSATEGAQIFGQWRWVEPNADGTGVLGQWSGECEVPSAHVIAGGVVRGPAISAGGDLVMARGDDLEVTSLASFALGWLPDGRAAIQVLPTPCSDPVDAGVYAVGVDGSMELLVATDRPISWVALAE